MIGLSPYTTGGYQPIKFEPHLHTLHSDGQDSVQDMFAACQSAGYAAVALTDHNTVSGLLEAADVAARLGLILVQGVEVTTFRGHAVALGVTRAPEWRDLEQRGMDALAAEVHAQGGVLSIAHPASIGSPVCSGCAWEWSVRPGSMDLVEVFSAPRPTADTALELWRTMLGNGARVAPIAAGDVHYQAVAAAPRAATYVYAASPTTEGVVEALRNRRVSAGWGAPIEFWLSGADGEVALMGDRVNSGDWTPHTSHVAAEFREVQVSGGCRALHAMVKNVQGELEAISAPIWIDTSH